MSDTAIQRKKAAKKRLEWLAFGVTSGIVAAFLILAYRGEVRQTEGAERERLGILSNVIANDISVNLIATNNALNSIIEDRFSTLSARPHHRRGRCRGGWPRWRWRCRACARC